MNFLTLKSIKAAVFSGVSCALAFTSADAATIISDNFSIAQGFVGVGPSIGAFNTSETSSVNVSPGANFTLNVPITAAALSTTGGTFVDGILANAGTGNNYTAYTTSAFLVTLDALYVGATPGDAAPTANYKMQLNITSIRIWAAGFAPQGDSYTLGWTETTSGNVQSQTPQSIETNPGPNWLYLANYDNVVWTPTGFQSAGFNQTRTFGLAESVANGFALDGFLVTGNIVMTYDAVPEPSTIGLIFLGITLAGSPLLRRRRIK